MPEDELKLEPVLGVSLQEVKEPSWLGKLAQLVAKAFREDTIDEPTAEALNKATTALEAEDVKLPEDARLAAETLKTFAKAAPPFPPKKPAEGYGYPDPGAKPEDKKCPDCGKPTKDCVCQKACGAPKEEKKVAKEDTVETPVVSVVPPEVLAKIDAIEKAANEKTALLEKSLSDMRVELEKARTETRRQTYLTKAVGLGLPVPSNELADFMIEVADKMPDKAMWLESALTAVAKQVQDAGFYNEIGSSYVPAEQQDLLAKMDAAVQKGVDPEAALLSMPAAEQAAYLTRRQAVAKG